MDEVLSSANNLTIGVGSQIANVVRTFNILIVCKKINYFCAR